MTLAYDVLFVCGDLSPDSPIHVGAIKDLEGSDRRILNEFLETPDRPANSLRVKQLCEHTRRHCYTGELCIRNGSSSCYWTGCTNDYHAALWVRSRWGRVIRSGPLPAELETWVTRLSEWRRILGNPATGTEAVELARTGFDAIIEHLRLEFRAALRSVNGFERDAATLEAQLAAKLDVDLMMLRNQYPPL